MTNTQEDYWSVDGVSLHTFAWNIETLSGRDAPPDFRGENIIIPGRPGRLHASKVADSRIIPLAMWVRAEGQDGSTPSNKKQSYDANWRQLKSLLWRDEGEQFELTKRFYHNGILRSATALVEKVGGLQPTMYGRFAAKFVVDLEISDIYFFDDVVSTYNLVNGDQTINVLGDAPTTNIIATINGPRKNAKVRVKSPQDVQFEYRDDMVLGDVATIDVMKWQSITDPAAVPPYNSSAKVYHSGSPLWLKLSPGDNVVNLASDTGAGSVQLQVRGAWL